MEDQFQEYWNKSKKEIFRLSLPVLTFSTAEKLRYEEYKKTGRIPVDKELSDWFASLSELKRKGIVLRRLQIIKFPVPPFTLFELKQLRLFKENSEDVLGLENQKFIRFCNGRDVKDFWLFANSKVLLPVYDENGLWLGHKRSSDDDASYLLELKKRLIGQAKPIEAFLEGVA